MPLAIKASASPLSAFAVMAMIGTVDPVARISWVAATPSSTGIEMSIIIRSCFPSKMLDCANNPDRGQKRGKSGVKSKKKKHGAGGFGTFGVCVYALSSIASDFDILEPELRQRLRHNFLVHGIIIHQENSLARGALRDRRMRNLRTCAGRRRGFGGFHLDCEKEGASLAEVRLSVE